MMNANSTVWQRLPIVVLCEAHVDCVNRTAPVVNEPTPFKMLRTTNVRNGYVDAENVRYVTEEIYKKWTRRLVPKRGDIILTREAPLGGVGKIRTDDAVFLGQRLYHFRPDPKKLDADFLLYSLLGDDLQSQIRGFGSGSTVEHMRLEDIPSLEFNVPPLPIQHRIAGILSAYDDLIENNQRRIRILEDMARSLYREWFVHFRYPGHESVRLVASPLGQIPQGWEVKKLGELVSVDKGVSYNGAGLTEDGNPMVNLKNILPGGGFRRDATKPYSGDFKPRHTVKPGDIILANTDLTQAGHVVASAALVPRFADERPILISHHLFAVRFVQNVPATFIYHLMLEDGFRGFAKGYAIGTTVLGLPKEGILNFTFAYPSEELVATFAKYVAPIHQHIETLIEQAANLRSTRDLLLPRLLSGQVELAADTQPLTDDAQQSNYDESEFKRMVAKGTQAWAGVSDSAAWVETLRGNKE